MVETAPENQVGVVSTPVACQLIMVSRQRIEQLVADGWIKRHARSQYRLVDVVQSL